MAIQPPPRQNVPMSPQRESPLDELAAAAAQVAAGDFDAAKQIFALTSPSSQPPEIAAVAEAFGLMAVRVEAREIRLERALEEIQRKNAALEAAARTRAEFGTIATFIVIVLCLYTIALAVMENVVKLDADLRRSLVESINFGFLVLQIGMALVYILKHKPRPEDYGWSLWGWKRSLSESLAFTAAAFAVMVGVKWLLVRQFSEMAAHPLVDWGYWGGWATVLSYLFVAPAQELIGRGFLQNSIENFLTGPRRRTMAILLTSVQFGVVHLHFSFSTGMVAMLSGILFGVMFVRQRTLLGVSLSHFILGSLAFGPLRLLHLGGS